jgi:hypothetical protein
MGVWDMMYLMQQYKKTLEQADNPAFSAAQREDFREKADDMRSQMDRYLRRVEARNTKG